MKAASPDGQIAAQPTDRAAAAYEEVFFQSANSNEARLRLLEERLTRPVKAARDPSIDRAAAEALSDSDDDLAEQQGFGVRVHQMPSNKKARRGSGPHPPAASGTSPLGVAAKTAGAAPRKSTEAVAGSGPGSGAAATGNNIANYFKRVSDGVGAGAGAGASHPSLVSPSNPPPFNPPATAVTTPATGPERKENYPPGSAGGGASRGSSQRAEHEWSAALEHARSAARREADEAKRRAAKLEADLTAARALNEELSRDLDATRARESAAAQASAARDAERAEGVKRLAVKVARHERLRARRALAEDGLRLGAVSVQRAGAVLQEVWEDGPAFRELDRRARELALAKDAAEAQRKAVKRKLPLPGTAAAAADDAAAVQAEYVLSEEVHKVRVAAIKKEEDGIAREREALEREKAAHIRELKRARDEDNSRFNQHPLLGGRYVLMNLLGRGGFSEVYKAYDTAEMREVACKLHQLSPQWSEERKRTYVRHAARECSIHKQLVHPAVVRLSDVFEVDNDSFCTVLELCTGDDLDARLKAHGSIVEREARAIMAQVFAGLAYLSGGARRVIHYDLKPGNILFDAAGRVKITDFGLSKVMEERAGGASGMGADSGMELTSQGAGTYWYLPPECFETGPAPPKISSKVDTWSCGVILYQMLFGRRPFGHDQSQEQILHSGTIRNAQAVEFPAKPSISPECKAFIQRCLAYRQADRPDVPTAARDPWITYAKAPPAAAAAGED